MICDLSTKENSLEKNIKIIKKELINAKGKWATCMLQKIFQDKLLNTLLEGNKNK